MLLFMVAGFILVLPALVVILWFIDRPMWILPAVASLLVNSLPFVAAILILRGQKGEGDPTEEH
ncbi:hypothetical protein BH23GEM3_BH23GEM3_17920 [soil metagenome]|jgi:Mn2+/Fe2+ NRAMP family transporter|nr:hypothetical protein [Gemmatimonadota bacterium]